jgi:hypothetical protein
MINREEYDREEYVTELFRVLGVELTRDDQGNDVILTAFDEVASYCLLKGCYLVNAETVKTDYSPYIRYWIMGDDLKEVVWSYCEATKELDLFRFYTHCNNLMNFKRSLDDLSSQEERESWLKEHCFFRSDKEKIRFDKCKALVKADKEVSL